MISNFFLRMFISIASIPFLLTGVIGNVLVIRIVHKTPDMRAFSDELSVGKPSCQRFDDHSNDLALDWFGLPVFSYMKIVVSFHAPIPFCFTYFYHSYSVNKYPRNNLACWIINLLLDVLLCSIAEYFLRVVPYFDEHVARTI